MPKPRSRLGLNHQQAVDTLKALPKHQRGSARRAMAVIHHLDRSSFARPTGYAEAVTAALIGQRGESVRGQAGTLAR